jgi:hypothetical protein
MDRKIFQAIASSNLPVRNIPERIKRRTRETTKNTPCYQKKGHENGRTKKEDRKIGDRKMTDERNHEWHELLEYKESSFVPFLLKTGRAIRALFSCVSSLS